MPKPISHLRTCKLNIKLAYHGQTRSVKICFEHVHWFYEVIEFIRQLHFLFEHDHRIINQISFFSRLSCCIDRLKVVHYSSFE